MSFTDYAPGSSSTLSNTGGGEAASDEYWTLHKLKQGYKDYLSSKQDEINEQKQSRRYYHAAQWTAEQIKVLKKRKQPVITSNRIGRKIDGVVGLIERLRQDPKAYPRTPKHEQGADLATAAIRYVLDQQDWKDKSPEVAKDGAVDGIAGIEIEIVKGDHDDAEIGFNVIEPDGFFYDPRSCRPDFSDSRFLGYGKWLDADVAKETFPDKADEIDQGVENATELSTNSDRELKWFDNGPDRKKLRVVDMWYQHKGKWCWCIFTGSMKLMEGQSYLQDEKNKDFCKYIMFSGNVDHDGDRYGFVRNMRSAQDEINMRRSKALHQLNNKRIFITQGAVQDVEKTRAEMVRDDGIVVLNPGKIDESLKVDDRTFDFAGQLKMLEDSKAEIENFGPNPALIGQGIENKSGRAIQLLQQAGIAELGPYILAYRGWKVRVYRAIWNALQKHWTGERWIRVTDDENLPQLIKINGLEQDPETKRMVMVNAIGSLDVDIILDESDDSITMMEDTYNALLGMASNGQQIPPQILIELAPNIDSRTKKKFKDLMEQSDQSKQQDPMRQIAQAEAAAQVDETKSQTLLNMAKAQQAGMPQGAPPPQQQFELPPEVQIADALAGIKDKEAGAAHKNATAFKTTQDATLAPVKLAHEVQQHHDQMQQHRDEQVQQYAFKGLDVQNQAEDRKIAARKPVGGGK